MTRILVLLAVMTLGILAQQPGAREKFYNPARGNVGIRYWFEDTHAAPSTSSRAADVGGRFTLHIRNNVGGGFLTVWSIEEKREVELTPREGPYAGFLLREQEYVVPGEFEFRAGATEKRVIVVFSRSQTEQASSPSHARERLSDIQKWIGRNGLQVISESDENTPGQVGTYVVNQDGGPLATEIIVR